MLGESIASLPIWHFCSIDLLVNSPRERLVHKVLEIGHSRDKGSVFGVVCKHDTDVVLLSEVLEVVEQLFYELEVLLLFVRDHVEQTRQAVDH